MAITPAGMVWRLSNWLEFAANTARIVHFLSETVPADA